MESETWTTWSLLDMNNIDRSDAGLFEVEEVNQNVNDLLEQGKVKEAEAEVERVRCLIAAAPALLAFAEMLVAGLESVPVAGMETEWAAALAVVAKAKGCGNG